LADYFVGNLLYFEFAGLFLFGNKLISKLFRKFTSVISYESSYNHFANFGNLIGFTFNLIYFNFGNK